MDLRRLLSRLRPLAPLWSKASGARATDARAALLRRVLGASGARPTDARAALLRYRTPGVIALLAVAIVASTAGVIVARDGPEDRAAIPQAGRRAQNERGTSFLARIVPPPGDEAATGGPRVPRTVGDLVRRLPLERKVAQLFLVGFQGKNLT